jgi:hypothetical protein
MGRIQHGRPNKVTTSNKEILKQYQDLLDNGFENPDQEGEHKGEAFSFKYEVLHGYLYIFDFTYHTDKRFSLSSVEIELLQSSLNTFNDIDDDY